MGAVRTVQNDTTVSNLPLHFERLSLFSGAPPATQRLYCPSVPPTRSTTTVHLLHMCARVQYPILAFATALVLLLFVFVASFKPPPFFTRMAPKDVLRFPPGFSWGTATSSYQIEGAVSTHRVPSIWDRFSHTPGVVSDNSTGDYACDHYNRFKEDVKLIKTLNTSHYRFSIAWPRIHTFEDPAAPQSNTHGIAFYNALIDELIANDITPVATLFHWDLPIAVEDSTGGWAGSGAVADRFEEYARLCFEKFGDRVKNWITLNEPWCSAVLGYEVGEHAPGDTSKPGVNVYKAGHNLLLAHGRAVKAYREDFQAIQKGKIGISLNTMWAEPKDRNNATHLEAAQRDMDFELGWFADPIWKGDYPATMRETVKDRLPEFTKDEKEMLKGSSDFFGLNHYSSQYATGMYVPDPPLVSHWNDKATTHEEDKDWKKTDMGWSVVPSGFRKLLLYVQEKYEPEGGILVTENGLASKEPTREAASKDSLRIEFYTLYIKAAHEAVGQGADVRGYFLWSLMDNFEWAFGYEKRFGLFFVDYKTMERVAKPAVEWYRKVTSTNTLEV